MCIGRKVFFGYFPSYALGHILSAQFTESLNKEIGEVEGLVINKDYAKILYWLQREVHSKGKKFFARDLIKDITEVI